MSIEVFGKFVRKSINEEGNTEITFSINSIRDTEILKRLSNDDKYRIKLTVTNGKRTLSQNAYMWELIHLIAMHRNGGRYENDDEQIYLEALERSGAKYEIIQCVPQAEELLKKSFRSVRFLNQYYDNDTLMNAYQVFYGSSTMDKNQMSNLLETVLDMASEEGVPLGDYYL